MQKTTLLLLAMVAGITFVISGCVMCGDGIPCALSNPGKLIGPRKKPKPRPSCGYDILAARFTVDGKIIIAGIEKLKTRAKPGQYVVVERIAAHRTRTPEDARSRKTNLRISLIRENYTKPPVHGYSNLDALVEFDLGKTPRGFLNFDRPLTIRRGSDYDVTVAYSVYGPNGRVTGARECIKFRYR